MKRCVALGWRRLPTVVNSNTQSFAPSVPSPLSVRHAPFWPRTWPLAKSDHFCVALFDEYVHRDHQFHLRSNSTTLINNIIWEVSRGITAMQSSVLGII